MKRRTAGDVMNPEILSVRVDLTLPELAAFLAEKQVTGAPVADGAGRLVGVVSLMDLAENQATPAAAVQDRGGSGAPTVGDIMTPTLYTVPDDTPVPQVARTMVAGRVHRLLVTRGGRVVGIVTTLDLLKLLYEEGAARAG